MIRKADKRQVQKETGFHYSCGINIINNNISDTDGPTTATPLSVPYFLLIIHCQLRGRKEESSGK